MAWKLLGWLVVALVLVGVVVLIAGCIQPPAGTVLIDLDGDGRADALARDLDRDGKPDIGADGKPLLIPDSGGYKRAEKIDAVAPDALLMIGKLLGATGFGAVVIGIGAAWKGARFARIFQNTVMSIQIARQRLRDKDGPGALEILDDGLSVQLPATVKAIKEAKEKMALKSVTDD